MKTKIILGLATLAALALPAMADDGNRYRDRDRDRGNYTQTYIAPRYGYDPNIYFDRDRNDQYRREMRERQERFEHERHERNQRYRDYR